MSHSALNPRGRGARANPANRFEAIHLEPDEDWDPAQDPAPATRFYRDATKSLIAYNQSPDIGFDASVNPYRGCEHGCVYCYARPTHEYLGFSAGLDFETRIMVKTDAPQLLRKELASPKWKPQVIALSGVTDCYQPAERKFQLTRRCLEVLLDFRNPAGIVTKNHLVTRDLDVLSSLAALDAAMVYVSITTLESQLAARMEPRTSQPRFRLAAIQACAQAGVPVGVLVAPVIPGLNDHEIPEILSASAKAGARCASYIMLRLPFGVKGLFADWLDRHYPERKDKVLGRLRSLRGGRLNDADFGTRMRGQGIWAEQIRALFEVSSRKVGLRRRAPGLSTAAFRIPSDDSGQKQISFPFA